MWDSDSRVITVVDLIASTTISVTKEGDTFYVEQRAVQERFAKGNNVIMMEDLIGSINSVAVNIDKLKKLNPKHNWT